MSGEYCLLASRNFLISSSKTQIAIEFAHSYHRQHPEAAVFCVFAGSAERVRESFSEVGRALEIPHLDNDECDTLKVVSDHLSDFRNGRWMIVLGNVDDVAVLSGVRSSGRTLESLLP